MQKTEPKTEDTTAQNLYSVGSPLLYGTLCLLFGSSSALILSLECYTVICIDFTYIYCIVCVLSVEVRFDISVIKELKNEWMNASDLNCVDVPLNPSHWLIKFFCTPCTLHTMFAMCRLPCSFMSHAVLGSYCVQSLFGDYDTREHGVGVQYFAHVNFAPQQSSELLEQIAEMHKAHRSQRFYLRGGRFKSMRFNRWFKSRFKSTDFFVKKSSDLNHTDDFTYQWKIIINKQMYCFIVLFNLFISSMTYFTVTGLCSNVQLAVL